MHPRLHSGLTNCDIATNRLMPVADVLVTDYSSLVFEYALYKKPWVIFAPDIESYSKGRSFYLDYKIDMPAPLVTEGEKLAQAVLDSERALTVRELSVSRKIYVCLRRQVNGKNNRQRFGQRAFLTEMIK